MKLNPLAIILIIAISTGQLLKLPIFSTSGPILLDFTIALLTIYGLTKFKLKKPPLSTSLGLIFTIISLLSLVLSPLILTQKEFLVSLSYTLRFALYLFFGWLLYSNAFKDLNQSMPKVFSVSGLILATLGLIQLFFLPNLKFLEPSGWDPHFYRTVSTFLDPNFLGAYLIISLFCLLAYPLKPNSKFQHLAVLLIYIATITTFSRSVLLMFITSLVAFSILSRSRKFLLISISLIAPFAIAIILYQQIFAAPKNIDRIQSAVYRLNSYQQGKELFLNHPLLGVGYNNYRFALAQYNLQPNQEILFGRASEANDSSLLQVLSTTGIVGFTLFIAFLTSIFWNPTKKALRSKDLTIDEKLTLSLLAGLLVHSLFINSLLYPPILLWIMTKNHKI